MDRYAITHCRICHSDTLYPFLDLGCMPVPNGFLRQEELGKPEPRYALGVTLCQTCWLVQLTHVVPPEVLFSNYLYIPSTSSTMLAHFQSMASSLITRFQLRPTDLVIDIGSNDGTLLSFFRQQGLPVLGIDPASNLAHVARMQGVNTINALFSSALATDLVRQNIRPTLITATNVVPHIHDVHDLCKGVRHLLSEEGIFVMECPYLLDLLENNEFDTIYHEHLSYFALHPLVRLFDLYDLAIFDVVRLPVHGGSMRLLVAPKGSQHTGSPALEACLHNELCQKIHSTSLYDAFAQRVYANAHKLMACLQTLKAEGKRVVGYGASAKSSVLLNVCKITTDLVEYVVDSIPYKQGRYTPGTHIPIYPEHRLEEDCPDYALLFAWNFQEEIIKKQARFRAKGGKFIVPIPEVQIVA